MSLTCHTTGAEVSWTWYHNGAVIVPATSTGPMSTYTVAATVLEDAGVYQCFATNPAGTSTHAAQIAIQSMGTSILYLSVSLICA